MANYTDNYNLTKPLGSDLYDIEVQNENMDKIDEALTDLVEEIAKTIPIEKGGTGKTTRSGAFTALSYIGSNPITSTAEDTPTKWGTFGTGFAKFSNLSCLVGQPAQHGLLFSICNINTSDVFQIWNTQSNGPTYFRSGNSSGWKDWRKVYDSNQIVPVEDGGTGATDAAAALANLGALPKSGGTVSGNLTVGGGESTKWLDVARAFSDDGSVYQVRLIMTSGKAARIGLYKDGNLVNTLQLSDNESTLSKPLTVASGGTGATSVDNALVSLKAFRKLNDNVVASTADDTTSNWSKIDSGYSYYNTNGLLNGQPTRYGILIHFNLSSEKFQIWRAQPNGPSYWRSGNTEGWSSWAKVYDVLNKPTLTDLSGTLKIANGGTGATTAVEALSALSIPNQGDWKTDAPVGLSLWKYEMADTVKFSLPYASCFILVMKEGDNRGAAIAFSWTTGNFKTYRSNLHDDAGNNNWSEWKVLLGEDGGTVSGNLTFKPWLGTKWSDGAGNTYLWRSGGESSPYLQLMVTTAAGTEIEAIRINGGTGNVDVIKGLNPDDVGIIYSASQPTYQAGKIWLKPI